MICEIKLQNNLHFVTFLKLYKLKYQILISITKMYTLNKQKK